MDIRTKNSQRKRQLDMKWNILMDFLYGPEKTENYNKFKSLFKDRTLVNSPIETTGPLAGFTALHLACFEQDRKLFSMLTEEDYHPDVNVTTEDGIQPIHLACFFAPLYFVDVLLKASANVNASFRLEVYEKFCKFLGKDSDIRCKDFGDKISLLEYSICHNSGLIRILLEHNADIKIITPTNRTLLMHALTKSSHEDAEIMSEYFNDQEILNHRDNDGRLVTHYLFNSKMFGNYPKYEHESMIHHRNLILYKLIIAGVDVSALVNGDPDTLLLNIAAYQRIDTMIQILLPYSTHITNSKALYYSTRPLENEEVNSWCDPNITMVYLDSQGMYLNELLGVANYLERRKKCIELVLKDLINRRTFGLPVPIEEETLMNELIQSDKNIANIVHNYKKDFIQDVLKYEKIHYGDKSITYYDFLLSSFNDKKLQVIVKDKNFMDSFEKSHINSDNYKYFQPLLEVRVKKAFIRAELLEKLKKLSQLRKAIPLPYELILDLIEFLDNKNLETFINAFFSM